MKTSKFLSLALLFAATSAVMSSCSVSDNEKQPEQVVDPITENTVYYIVGKVVDQNNNPLNDVEIKGNGLEAVKTANGQFKVEVDDKKSYELTATKEGYLSADATATFASNATNRSSASVSFKLTKKEASVPVNVAEETIVEDAKKTVSAVIPANTVEEAGTTVSMTPYIADKEVSSNTASVVNLHVETNKAISGKDIKLAVNDPEAGSVNKFKTLDVYKQQEARAAENFVKIGTATLVDGKYELTLDANVGKLEGTYVFAASYSRNESGLNTESIKEGKVDNSGNFEAKLDVTISYTAKMGWEYDETPSNKLIANAIEAEEGAAGTFNADYSETASISGNNIMYWNAVNVYKTVTYTFPTQPNKTVVKLKKYTGVQFNYRNETASQHSGGTSNGN